MYYPNFIEYTLYRQAFAYSMEMTSKPRVLVFKYLFPLLSLLTITNDSKKGQEWHFINILKILPSLQLLSRKRNPCS